MITDADIERIRDLDPALTDKVLALKTCSAERHQALNDMRNLMPMPMRRRLQRCPGRATEPARASVMSVHGLCDRYRFFDEPCPHCQTPARDTRRPPATTKLFGLPREEHDLLVAFDNYGPEAITRAVCRPRTVLALERKGLISQGRDRDITDAGRQMLELLNKQENLQRRRDER